MPLQERNIRYKSSAGHLHVPEVDWEVFFGDAGDRARRIGRNGLRLKQYLADQLEKHRSFVKLEFDAKTTAEDDRNHDERVEAQVLLERSELLQSIGKASLWIQGKQSRDEKCFPRQSRDGTITKQPTIFEFHGWDTKGWSKIEIEGALDTLIQEIRTSPQHKRRNLASRMILNLVQKHRVAKDHIELVTPSLIEISLFVPKGGSKKTSESIRISHFMAELSLLVPQFLSRYSAARKCSNILVHRHIQAAKVIQGKWRLVLFARKDFTDVHVEDKLRRKTFLIVGFSDSLQQWKKLQKSFIAELSTKEKISLLMILTSLASDANSGFDVKDRKQMVEIGVLQPVQGMCLASSFKIRSSALQLLTNLARERNLCFPLLESGVHETMSILIRSNFLQDRMTALEVLDLLAENLTGDYDSASWIRAWEMFCKAGGSLYCLMEGEENMSLFRKSIDPVWMLIESSRFLIDRKRDGGLFRWMRNLISSENELTRLGATLTLSKLACGLCNYYILCIDEKRTINEIDEQRYLENRTLRLREFLGAIVKNMADPSSEGLAVASLQLLAQLCATPNGRKAFLNLGIWRLAKEKLEGPLLNLFILLLVTDCQRPIPLEHVEDISKLHGNQRILGCVLELDAFASLIDLEKCLDMSVSIFASNQDTEALKRGLTTLVTEIGALSILQDFIRSRSEIGALLLGRMTVLLGNMQLLSPLFMDEVILSNTFGIIKNCWKRNPTPLVKPSVVEALEVLKFCAKHKRDIFNQPNRWNVLLDCAGLTKQGQAWKRCSFHACELISLLTPSKGSLEDCNFDLVSGNTSQGMFPFQVSNALGEEKKLQQFKIARARENARRARDDTINSIGWMDVASTVEGDCFLHVADACAAILLDSLRMQTNKVVMFALAELLCSQELAKRITLGSDIFQFLASSKLAMRSIPSFFSLLAALARCYEGKEAVLRHGFLNLAIEVLIDGGSVKLLGETALVVARVANVHHPLHGSSNEILLQNRNRCVLKQLVGISQMDIAPARARVHCLVALAQLFQDEVYAVPRLLGNKDGIETYVTLMGTISGDMHVAIDSGEPIAHFEAMLSHLLRIVHAIASFSSRDLQKALLEFGTVKTLEGLSRLLSRRQKQPSINGVIVQPTVSSMCGSVLDSLKTSASFGSELARETERCQESIIDQFREDEQDFNLRDFSWDPFSSPRSVLFDHKSDQMVAKGARRRRRGRRQKPFNTFDFLSTRPSRKPYQTKSGADAGPSSASSGSG